VARQPHPSPAADPRAAEIAGLIATMEAAVATEKPVQIRINGRAMDTKPLLIPYGSTKKKKVSGLVEAGSRTD
jgi:hypothetical protein